jgi:hypothetical protein
MAVQITLSLRNKDLVKVNGKFALYPLSLSK